MVSELLHFACVCVRLSVDHSLSFDSSYTRRCPGLLMMAMKRQAGMGDVGNILAGPACKRARRANNILVGSDCTGLNVARLAFESLGLGSIAIDVFASEKDKATRDVLQHNFKFDRCVYHDITTRLPADAPYVHFYSAGFPCTPYSGQGLHQGLASDAGKVGLHCLLFIAKSKPKTFLLENVANLASERHWSDFKLIMDDLLAVKDSNGNRMYQFLGYKVMNSVHYGVAQNRRRIYIVGMQKELKARPFKWPSATPTPALDNFLDDHVAQPAELPTNATEQRNFLLAVKEIKGQGRAITDNYVADLGGGFKAGGKFSANVAYDYSPCLTKSRCGGNAYYVFSRQRKLTLNEYFRLQGFQPGRIQVPRGVSERQVRGMIGNSFTMPVVADIIDRMMYSSGLTKQPSRFVLGTGDVGQVHRPQ